MRAYYLTRIAFVILLLFNIFNCYRNALRNPDVGVQVPHTSYQTDYSSSSSSLVLEQFDTTQMIIGTVSKAGVAYHFSIPAKLLYEIRATINRVDSLNGAVKERLKVDLPAEQNP